MATASVVVTFDDKEIKDLLFAEAKRRMPAELAAGGQSIKITTVRDDGAGGIVAETKSLEAEVSFKMTVKV